MKRSTSVRSSLSVGSTMSVPATGNDIVGAWKPKVDEPLGDVLRGDACGLGEGPQVQNALVRNEPIRAAVEHGERVARGASAM